MKKLFIILVLILGLTTPALAQNVHLLYLTEMSEEVIEGKLVRRPNLDEIVIDWINLGCNPVTDKCLFYFLLRPSDKTERIKEKSDTLAWGDSSKAMWLNLYTEKLAVAKKIIKCCYMVMDIELGQEVLRCKTIKEWEDMAEPPSLAPGKSYLPPNRWLEK